MADFLPSKKIILVFTLLTVFGGGFLAYKNGFWQKNKLVYDPSAAVRGDSIERNIADLDSDGDGLKDWQEQLFGTDSNNSDTDGDGILDGNESVGEAGLAPGIGLASATESAIDEGVSQKFIKDAITGYLALRSSGLDDKSIFQALLQKYQDEYMGVNSLVDTYSQEEVLITAATPAAIRNYADNAAKILDSNFRNINKSELALFYEFEQSGGTDLEILARFSDYQRAYLGSVAELKSIFVPETYASMHAELVNNLQNVAVINGAFVRMASDPLSAILHLGYYKKESERFLKVMSGVGKQLVSDNLNFSDEEYGSMFIYYLAMAD